MSVQYAAVKWNRNKRIYDSLIAVGIVLYLAAFIAVGKWVWQGPDTISDEVLTIRALGTCAFLLLHVVLCIGPLARFDPRFLPLLYNRRHLGVSTFLVALVHGSLATGFYHAFGRLNPLVSLLSTNTQYGSIAGFPFETLGVLALLVLFLMAATSHDFWLRNLSPSVWKGLHMLVYPAYGLAVLHVTLGVLQANHATMYAILLGVGVTIVASLHLAAGWREQRRDRRSAETSRANTEPWVEVGRVEEVPANRAKIVCLEGQERIAVFRHGDLLSAVTNVCAHQRGPLGEGKIIDGCITCPWHGWEYRPETGQSPPPFTERIVTYRIRVEKGSVLLDPRPLPPGTPVPPASCKE